MKNKNDPSDVLILTQDDLKDEFKNVKVQDLKVHYFTCYEAVINYYSFIFFYNGRDTFTVIKNRFTTQMLLDMLKNNLCNKPLTKFSIGDKINYGFYKNIEIIGYNKDTKEYTLEDSAGHQANIYERMIDKYAILIKE